MTVFDNRGICQHSGFCTDRLPTVFRTGAEPFVAPSGGRADEIIRAVRDCPSGALSLAFDGTEARDLADWHGRREQAVEVSLDGPYRVTGGMPLADAGGADVPAGFGVIAGALRALPVRALAEQAVLQRHALVRAVPRPGLRPADPTLFEWAGGLPALTRMTRLLYEKPCCPPTPCSQPRSLTCRRRSAARGGLAGGGVRRPAAGRSDGAGRPGAQPRAASALGRAGGTGG